MPKPDKVSQANFNLLKIEGRNKSKYYYVAQLARVYFKVVDDYFENPPINW